MTEVGGIRVQRELRRSTQGRVRVRYLLASRDGVRRGRSRRRDHWSGDPYGTVHLRYQSLDGLGGVSAAFAWTQSGLALLLGETNLEVGIAVNPWMQLYQYAGLQGIADIDPQAGVGTRLANYSPVVGMRLAWGSFNAAW